jgi:hypothetical protein
MMMIMVIKKGMAKMSMIMIHDDDGEEEDDYDDT